MTIYRLTFEIVKQSELAKYCNEDPRFYKNVTQTVPNSEIPDEDWYKVTKETNDPWQQYNQLVEWTTLDKEFVRNITLEEQIEPPTWRKL